MTTYKILYGGKKREIPSIILVHYGTSGGTDSKSAIEGMSSGYEVEESTNAMILY